MISIYHEHHAATSQTVQGRRLICKATWIETNAKNLHAAVGAIAHAPSVGASEGEFHVEIVGIMFTVDQLPKYGGPDLLKRCSCWLDNLRRSQRRPARPVFGL